MLLISKLISFDKQKFEQLLEYVLIDYPNLDDKKAAYKFPNVAAELLSMPNPRVIEFFAIEDANGALPNFEAIFSPFLNSEGHISTDEMNFTRAAYIQKILNNLIVSQPVIFATYLLRQSILTTSLFAHSYCKSISIVLLNLIAPTPGTIIEINKTEQSTNTTPSTADILKDTLPDRLSLYRQLIEGCLASAEVIEEIDLNANLGNVMMAIMTKDFSERGIFLQLFVEYLDEIFRGFVKSFPSPLNNKLGNVFLVFLEVMFRETDREAANLKLPESQIEGFAEAYLQLLEPSIMLNRPVSKENLQTLTFSFEMLRVNVKTYKVLEALLMILKHCLSLPTFPEGLFTGHEFEKTIFSLFSNHPFNNILHNQLKKILLAIAESNNEKLHSVYFLNNAAFFEFIQSISDSPHTISLSKKHVRKGYIGQIMALCTTILKNEPLRDKLITGKLKSANMAKFSRKILFS